MARSQGRFKGTALGIDPGEVPPANGRPHRSYIVGLLLGMLKPAFVSLRQRRVPRTYRGRLIFPLLLPLLRKCLFVMACLPKLHTPVVSPSDDR